MASMLTRKRRRRVADMTEDELKRLVKSSVKQSLREMINDPDEGLELRPEIIESLLQQEKDFVAGKRGVPLEEAAKRLRLD